MLKHLAIGDEVSLKRMRMGTWCRLLSIRSHLTKICAGNVTHAFPEDDHALSLWIMRPISPWCPGQVSRSIHHHCLVGLSVEDLTNIDKYVMHLSSDVLHRQICRWASHIENVLTVVHTNTERSAMVTMYDEVMILWDDFKRDVLMLDHILLATDHALHRLNAMEVITHATQQRASMLMSATAAVLLNFGLVLGVMTELAMGIRPTMVLTQGLYLMHPLLKMGYRLAKLETIHLASATITYPGIQDIFLRCRYMMAMTLSVLLGQPNILISMILMDSVSNVVLKHLHQILFSDDSGRYMAEKLQDPIRQMSYKCLSTSMMLILSLAWGTTIGRHAYLWGPTSFIHSMMVVFPRILGNELYLLLFGEDMDVCDADARRC